MQWRYWTQGTWAPFPQSYGASPPCDKGNLGTVGRWDGDRTEREETRTEFAFHRSLPPSRPVWHGFSFERPRRVA
jgi:hypothetical protein